MQEDMENEYLVPAKAVNMGYQQLIGSILKNFMNRETALLESIDMRLKVLEEKIGKLDESKEPLLIVAEQISRKEAKEKVLEYIKKHKTSDIAEIHSAIRCDIETLIEIIDELIKEGKIKG